MFFSTPALDLQIFLLVNQQWRNGLFDFIMPIFSAMSVLMVIMAAALAFAVYKGGKRQIFYFLVLAAAMGMSDFSTKLVKDQVHRVRPLNAVSGTYFMDDGEWTNRPPGFVFTKERGSSYPSAHASTTMAIAVLAILLWPGLRKWPLLLPLAVGYSRIYLGKHYPTDVLAGWIWGMIIAGTVWLIWREIERRYLPPDTD